MNKKLSNFVNNMQAPATLAMAQKAREVAAEGHDVINLSIGEPDFDTPQHIKDACIAAIQAGHTSYTPVPGILALREAICDKLKRENGLSYQPSQIVVSTGAKQSIANVALALLQEGDEAVLITPYWVSYLTIAEMTGANAVALAADISNDFKVTAKQLKDCLNEKSKLVIFSSPCNPTGAVYTKSELEALAEVLREFPNVYVISDEIYEHINFGAQHASLASIDGMYEKTITINGFSKGYAMTGWRLGYLAAPEWIAKAAAKIQGQFTSGTCNFNQHAAVTALNGDMQPTKDMTASYLKRRDMMIELLKPLTDFQFSVPDGAFYLFPDVSRLFGKIIQGVSLKSADDVVEFLLDKAHIATVTGTAFGDSNCIRLSIATSEDKLREAAERLLKLFA